MMIPKPFKILGITFAIIIAIPIVAILGFFLYVYTVHAFPSNSLAAERFEENGNYMFPKNATDIYFRLAVPSPLDRGSSVLRFSAENSDLLNILKTPPHFGVKWKVLEDDFVCHCSGCPRHWEPVTVPAGSSYWMYTKSESNYVLMAVDIQTNQVFKCAIDS